MERSPNISWLFHLRVLCKYTLPACLNSFCPVLLCLPFFQMIWLFSICFWSIALTHEMRPNETVCKSLLLAHKARCNTLVLLTDLHTCSERCYCSIRKPQTFLVTTFFLIRFLDNFIVYLNYITTSPQYCWEGMAVFNLNPESGPVSIIIV